MAENDGDFEVTQVSVDICVTMLLACVSNLLFTCTSFCNILSVVSFSCILYGECLLIMLEWDPGNEVNPLLRVDDTLNNKGIIFRFSSAFSREFLLPY